MSSKQFTMQDVENSEKKWKAYVAENEIRLLKTYKDNNELHLAYDKAEKNAWIVRTLRDKKQRYLFNTCKNLIMVGSGIYPYSMFDVHRQYPHINQIGLEVVKSRAVLSKKIALVSFACRPTIARVNECDSAYLTSWQTITVFTCTARSDYLLIQEWYYDISYAKDISQTTNTLLFGFFLRCVFLI